MGSRSNLLPALASTLLAGILFWWLVGNRVDLLNDEGIYLDGARRILAGQAPYRDFFALTGPGTFWNLAVLFRLLGTTFSSARLLLVFDLALLAGGLFWLSAQFVSRLMAGVLTFGFVSLLAGNGGMLKVTHRWDSSAAAFAGVILFYVGSKSRRTAYFLAAGMASGYAAWITPSVLLVPATIAAWLLLQRTAMRQAMIFLAGVALVSGAAILVLSIQGSLLPMAEHLLWTSRNYSGANRVAYGSIPGGYAAVFADASGGELAVRLFVLCFVALPALLPLTSMGWFTRPRGELLPVLPLLLCAGALMLSSLPRWDLDHMEYIEPLFLALTGAWLARVLPPRALVAVGMIFAVTCVMFLAMAVGARWTLPASGTRRGLVHGSQADLTLVKNMLESVPAGQSVFVYPYLPTFYFFTDGINPTQYSYFQPGMMTQNDESRIIADLERQPPCCVVYNDLPQAELLRVFPSTDPARLRPSRVADWLRRHYAPRAGGGPAERAIELWLLRK